MHRQSYEETKDERSYRTTSHFCAPHHITDGRPTIVFANPPDWYTAVHEFGHAIHAFIGHTWTAAPISEYAKTDPYEAFAEAFTGWCCKHTPDDYLKLIGFDVRALRTDKPTLSLFDWLAGYQGGHRAYRIIASKL